MKKTSVKKDIILVTGLFLIGAIIAVVVMLSGGKGGIVQVSIDGKVTAEYPLNSYMETDIRGVGDGVNHLVIRDGEAWLDYADCPDGLCVNMGKISRNGQSIICLPHKVVVRIVAEGEASNSEKPDIVVR